MDLEPARFLRPTEMAHSLVRPRLRAGDHAIDATVGNGHDTLFLAECVGEDGRVSGFDIQREAIAKTEEKTSEQPQVTLFELGHEKMGTALSTPVRAIMFNLGYLPSGNKSVITRPDTTVMALTAAVGLLAEGGIITIVIYPGHEGGAEEAEAVLDWSSTLSPDQFVSIRYQFLNRPKTPPYLVGIERVR